MKKTVEKILVVLVTLSVISLSTVGCSSSNKLDNKTANANKSESKNNKKSSNKPCIWEIKNGKSTVYLFGSMHMVKKDIFPFDKTIEDAFVKSNNLVLERDVSDEKAEDELATKYYYYPKNDSVYNHLSAKGKEKLDSFSKELGLKVDAIKEMKIGVIGSIITFSTLEEKLSYTSSVEQFFIGRAKGSKKILEIEDKELIASKLSNLPNDEMEKCYLLDTNLKKIEECYKNMYEAYKCGDDKTIAKLSLEELKKYPVMYKTLLTDRNVNMAEKIDGYLKTNDTYFVVVGLAHYVVGEDSVIKLLEKKGYTVKRL